MRHVALILICMSILGCASSNDATLPQRVYCEDRYSNLWRAAMRSVGELGFSIVNANDVAGSILGRMEADVYGSELEISVSISRDPGASPGSNAEQMWVQAKVIDAGVSSPDEYRREQMELMEDQFMQLMRQMAVCGAEH